jgi:3-isopropylmalate/(R)-2-methylmalate dehydratase small subunit
VEPFSKLTAVAAPLIRANVDTDAIIPSREMKTVSKTGLADGLFAGWRYREVGGRDPQPEFVLNDPAYAGAQILLSGVNFGCGSSREHAVWALAEYGFRAILAESFSPIFLGNCVRNGVAPVELPGTVIAAIAADIAADPQARRVAVDLVTCTVTAPDGAATPFRIDAEARGMLLEGLDAIDLTLKRRTEIEAFREADRQRRPWIYL